MYNPDTELLFPLRVVTHLKALRGEDWSMLIDRLQDSNCPSVDRIAFSLMMARMGGCVSCDSDSFRAMRGCTACAKQTVKRFRGTDSDLLEQLRVVRREIDIYLKKQSAFASE